MRFLIKKCSIIFCKIFKINVQILGKSRYYDDKKTSNMKSNWEITVSKTNNQKTVIEGRLLFSLRHNVPKSSGHQEILSNGLMMTRMMTRP